MKIAAATIPDPACAALVRLGSRVRALRVVRGWTIAEMAERLFCSPTTWRALEAGKPGTSIGLLAHALWLLGEVDSLDQTAPAPPLMAARKRVRRAAGQSTPGRIARDELDF